MDDLFLYRYAIRISIRISSSFRVSLLRELEERVVHWRMAHDR